ncbi:MAG: 50S ribosomal protein L37e [Candidatus Aenigmarchaeota archaeon]|nr:50S ribosomal protein L37e [Candidatus Aenigmarchaeota archaeon]
MAKGTPSFGKHQTISHINCKRCGRHSYHIKMQKCSACGYPRAKIRQESWRRKLTNRSARKAVKVLHMKQKTTRRGRR